MENQSTNDNSTKPVENRVVCRKCGGPHFTIKCGKEKQPEQTSKSIESNSDDKKSDENKTFDKTNRNDKGEKKSWSNGGVNDKNERYGDRKPRYDDKPYERKPYFKTTFRVKLSELPTNMTEEEMMELTCDWGHVVRIRVINYPEASVAYIDFGYEEEAEYFVKAIDKTPFEFLVISAQRVESQRPEAKAE